ncbi:MAG TPA: type IV toxin-antitoxin system AbiEi family antitoxin domain-containing protein [Streptosporangiaceae bacterium]|nr:type IV toxin-antitoxin system AbiEi family antitoxin domain-containing protein [Streptosporangiaceae bacterium]
MERQSGIVSRAQAVRAGLAPAAIDNQLRSGRWQRLQHGVYATFTGPPGREAVLWGVLLRAGPAAALSHRTAADFHNLADEPSRVVHVTVPNWQRVAPISGVIIHHSRAFDTIVHPTASPPRTRVEHTVLDLSESCASFDDAFAWLCRAVGRGLTTPELMRAAMAERSRLRWRSDLANAVGDIGAGLLSLLERRYVYDVERAHGLPQAKRQAQTVVEGRSRYIDNLYEEALLAVELDGQAAHPPERRWSDSHRDNAHAALGLQTLRYSWSDVKERPCAVAAEVGALLKLRGQTVRLRRCGPNCSVALGARQVA